MSILKQLTETKGGGQCSRSSWRTSEVETVDEQVIGVELGPARPDHPSVESCTALQMPWEGLVGRSWPIGWLQ